VVEALGRIGEKIFGVKKFGKHLHAKFAQEIFSPEQRSSGAFLQFALRQLGEHFRDFAYQVFTVSPPQFL